MHACRLARAVAKRLAFPLSVLTVMRIFALNTGFQKLTTAYACPESHFGINMRAHKVLPRNRMLARSCMRHFVLIFLCNLSCSTFLAFLRRYHANQVIMKIGRTSAPGTSSNKLITPIQRKIKRQATIPTISSISPITGIIKLAAMYSLISNSRHSMRENNSTPLKIKYSGTGLNSLSNSTNLFLVYLFFAHPNKALRNAIASDSHKLNYSPCKH